MTKIHLMKRCILLVFLAVLTSQALLGAGQNNPLAGKTFTISYNSLSNIFVNGFEITFTGNQLSFRGCNQNTANYTLDSKGKFSIKGQWSATKTYCLFDFDPVVSNLFSNSTQITQRNGSIEFSKGSTIYLKLTPSNPLKGKKLIIQSTSLGKNSIIGYSVRFTDQHFIFKGCKSHLSPYKIGKNNQFSLDSLWISNLVPCLNEDDTLVEQLFGNSTRFQVKFDGKIYFYDKNNNVLVQIGASAGSLPLNPFIGKKFIFSSLPSNISRLSGTSISFIDGFITFKYCSINHASYSIGSDNRFYVKYWASLELWKCQTNYDEEVFHLFDNVTTYKLDTNGNAQFYNNESKLLVQLKQLQQSLPEFQGKFTIQENAAKNNGINGLVIQFTKQDSNIIFIGCNINGAGYTAQSDGYFNIEDTWMSTKIACQSDNDPLLIHILQLASKFTLEGSELKLFDFNSRLLLRLQGSS